MDLNKIKDQIYDKDSCNTLIYAICKAPINYNFEWYPWKLKASFKTISEQFTN